MVVEDWEGEREVEGGEDAAGTYFWATVGRRRHTPMGDDGGRRGGPGGGALGAPRRSPLSRPRGALGGRKEKMTL